MRFSRVTRRACACACACALVFMSTVLTHTSERLDSSSHARTEVRESLTAKAETAMTAAAGAQEEEVTTANAPAKKRPNLFVRIISAPFRGLAKLFGGGRKGGKTARVKPKEERWRDAEITAAPSGAAVNQTSSAQATTGIPPHNAPMTPAALSQADRVAENTALPVRAGETISPLRRAEATPVTPLAPPSVAAVASLPRATEAADEEALDYEPGTFTPFIEGVPGDPLSQGRALLANGYPNEAISELSVAAVTGPDLVEANNLLGLAHDRRGRHTQAREFYERALSVAPRNAEVINNLGHSLYLDGRHTDALARLKDAARLAPADQRVANNLALVYGRLNKYDDVFRQYKRAGGEFYARTSTARLLVAAGRDRDAIKHYEAARKLNPASSEVLRQLITLYVRTGQRDKAEAAQRALDKTTDQTSAVG